MSKPLVSIVTPSYNHGKYIEATILSVLTQDYPNIEYIVMDGGSTDCTAEIVEKYRGRLTFVSERDRGPEDAINKGLRLAKGEILAWLASDDTYEPGAISRAVEIFQANKGVGMVYGRSHYIDRDSRVIGECPTEPFDYQYLAVYNIIAQPSCFFRRSVYAAAGELSLELKQATDYDLWIRMAKETEVVYLPEFLSSYRLHDAGKTLFEPLMKFTEYIEITRKYYSWVPANRVYPYCLYVCKERFPAWLLKLDPLVKGIALVYAAWSYLVLNRGVKWQDIKLLPRNFKKFVFGWELQKLLKDRLPDI